MSIIGIDLGTTNSLVACYRDHESKLIPNSLGNYLTPSVVSVLENGEIIVGAAAKERLITNPEITIAAFKRYMGTNKKYQLGRHTFNSTDLSAFVLKSLKADAEVYLGECVTEAIISVPAYFNNQQRRATYEAGKLAGLQVERLINEPTAAAVAYGMHQKTDEQKLLIFDLGGGTFDVSILEIFEDILEICAVAGDNFLGGEDFDECLIKYFCEMHNLNLDRLPIDTLVTLKKQAEKSKIALTLSNSATMVCRFKDQVLETTITETIFESIAGELLLKLKNPLLKALKDSNNKTNDLDDIILVGGSSKMPIIRNLVTKMFGRFPLVQINPDEVVGIGIGICAGIKERHEALKEKVLTDVCPYTLGTAVVTENQFGEQADGIFFPIIERNTTIPYSKVDRLYNAVDNQKKIKVAVYQGESRLVENNLKLGELMIKIPPAPKGQSAIDVRYTYNIDGILEVEVTSVQSGLKKSIVLCNSDTNLTDDQIAVRLKELEKIKIHPRDQVHNCYLLEKAERLYEESLAETRMLIAKHIEYFSAVLDRQKPKEIEIAIQEMENFLSQLEAGDFI